MITTNPPEPESKERECGCASRGEMVDQKRENGQIILVFVCEKCSGIFRRTNEVKK